MTMQLIPATDRYEALGPVKLDEIARRYPIPPDLLRTMRLFSLVLPFRVNSYVLSQLIDWDAVPADPIFQLVFPVDGILSRADEQALAAAQSDRHRLAAVIARLRAEMNPHPSGQQQLNVPARDGRGLAGLQHKYAETVLYFPQQGQMCHAYCTYCFRWAQFVGDRDLRFAAAEPGQLVEYLRRHPQVTDVLITGGDPMIMSSARLRQHIEPILDVPTVRTIRIGTKSVAYWPQRFVSDLDADSALRFFEQIVATGRGLAVMAHYSHAQELRTDLSRQAVRRILATGAKLYCQAPLIGHVNDDPNALAELWRTEHALGAVPYYLFVARDTGPYEYFKVPLIRAQELFATAYRQLPGLARTIRGPVMSATPGKVIVDGCLTVAGNRLLSLRFLQARDSSLVGRPFLATGRADAAWLPELRPAPGTPADLVAAVRTAGTELPESL